MSNIDSVKSHVGVDALNGFWDGTPASNVVLRRLHKTLCSIGEGLRAVELFHHRPIGESQDYKKRLVTLRSLNVSTHFIERVQTAIMPAGASRRTP